MAPKRRLLDDDKFVCGQCGATLNRWDRDSLRRHWIDECISEETDSLSDFSLVDEPSISPRVKCRRTGFTSPSEHRRRCSADYLFALMIAQRRLSPEAMDDPIMRLFVSMLNADYSIPTAHRVEDIIAFHGLEKV